MSFVPIHFSVWCSSSDTVRSEFKLYIHLFAQVLKQLHVKHNKYHAPYHVPCTKPRCTSAFSSNAKITVVRINNADCTKLSGDWADGLPWLLLAARELVHDSSGYCPSELVLVTRCEGHLKICQMVGCLRIHLKTFRTVLMV